MNNEFHGSIMKTRATITSPDKAPILTEVGGVPLVCNLVDGVVGWCDAWDLVFDLLDRQGFYFFTANGYRVDFEVIA
jgi:hypothetical protein